MIESHEIHLASHPKGIPTAANFIREQTELKSLPDQQVLVRNLFMSVDPYMRGRISGRKSYMPSLAFTQGGFYRPAAALTLCEKPPCSIWDWVNASQRTRCGDDHVPLQLWPARLLFRATGKIVTQSKKRFAANPEDKQGSNHG